MLYEIIPTEIICAIISAVISWAVTRYTCKKEIEKLKLTWQHEAAASFDESFESMAYTVTQYTKNGSDTTWRDAVSNIAAVRAKCSEDLAYSLDALQKVASRRDMKGTEIALTKAIEAKREIDSNRDATKKHK